MFIMLLKRKFKIGQAVYLKTDPEIMPRICIAYCVRFNSITYELALGTNSSWHYEVEITEQEDGSLFSKKQAPIGLCPPERK